MVFGSGVELSSCEGEGQSCRTPKGLTDRTKVIEESHQTGVDHTQLALFADDYEELN